MPSLSMPTRTKRPAEPGGKLNGSPSALPKAPALEPPGRRRRPKWALAGLAVLIVGGLLGMYLYSATGGPGVGGCCGCAGGLRGAG